LENHKKKHKCCDLEKSENNHIHNNVLYNLKNKNVNLNNRCVSPLYTNINSNGNSPSSVNVGSSINTHRQVNSNKRHSKIDSTLHYMNR